MHNLEHPPDSGRGTGTGTEYLKLCGINPLDRAYDDIINLGLELGLGAGLGGWARSGQG